MDVTCDVMIIISRTSGHLWDEQWLGHINNRMATLLLLWNTGGFVVTALIFFHIRRLTTSSCSKKQVTQRLKTLHACQCQATHLQTIAVGLGLTKQRFVQSFHQRVQLVFDGSQVIETTSRFLEAFSKFCFKSLRFWKFDVTFCVWRQATNFTFFKVNFCIITNRLHVIDPLLVGCKQTNFVLLP